jgi:hypothetical protein
VRRVLRAARGGSDRSLRRLHATGSLRLSAATERWGVWEVAFVFLPLGRDADDEVLLSVACRRDCSS